MIKRDDVIHNAELYINISSWVPANDTVAFPEIAGTPTFTSCFWKNGTDHEKKVSRTYSVVPYVYGGFDSICQFRSKVSRNDISPGGWDRTTGKTTSKYFTEKEVSRRVQEGQKEVESVKKNKEYLAHKYLAGIDCSGYVTRCWGLKTKKGTSTIPAMSLKIEKARLGRGDVLNKAGDHVILFHKWQNPNSRTTAYVYESHGGGEKRAFRDGDTKGQVIHHTREWSWFESEGYIPYSPFPQIQVIPPHESGPVTIRVEGSGDIEVLAVAIDGDGVPFTQSKRGTLSKKEKGSFEEVQPQVSLAPGRHVFQVSASNRTAGESFWEEFSGELALT